MTFGDVFQYENKEYVYLGAKGENLHAALILDENITKQFVRLEENRIKRSANGLLKESTAFCYVILETSDLKGRACHFSNTQSDSNKYANISSMNIKLIASDLKRIKDEIMTKPVSKELRDLVKDISLP